MEKKEPDPGNAGVGKCTPEIFYWMKSIGLLLAGALYLSMAHGQAVIKGKVKDQNGRDLAGATVLVDGTYIGTYTDAQGRFELSGSKDVDSVLLKISMVGYNTKSLWVTTKGVKDRFEVRMEGAEILMDAFVVDAVRASDRTPMTKSNVSREEIAKMNLGQDLPILLNMQPSLVTTSDAGAGIGYTGMRIRGSDASRINVTINGIPLNDAESQGVFWVNMPDFASSANSIQIQRGAGTSTNGSGAFGASINIQTDQVIPNEYAQISSSFGSFNSQKFTVKAGTGWIGDDRFAVDARASRINSDGYIDRATADLESYYLSSALRLGKGMLKFITFSGHERTYQSWWGTPQSRIENDVAGMNAHADNNGLSDAQRANLLRSGRTYNYYQYENEVDDYGQDHYQLHLHSPLTNDWRLNASLNYTLGAGYFEQFREDDDFADYGLTNPIIGMDTITNTDLIRRRWLDNEFFGGSANATYKKGKTDFTLGLSAFQYEGRHFGEIIWSEFAGNSEHQDEYYSNMGYKFDGNGFAKLNFNATSDLLLYIDFQARHVQYSTKGKDNDQRRLNEDTSMTFFNPKFGISYTIDQGSSIYASYANASREPTRNDFIDAVAHPLPETLHDLEFGFTRNTSRMAFSATVYYMLYNNQLVLTGELNDVGTAIRTNVKTSYRRGLELSLSYRPLDKLTFNSNFTLSQNQISSFSETLYDYTNGFDVLTNVYSNSNISFSPGQVGFIGVEFTPVKKSSLGLNWKYVGKQYLDNTSNDDRSIDAYNTLDFVGSYTLETVRTGSWRLQLLVNNLLNSLYSSNGYTYSYVVGSTITENFYYPQASTNFLVGLTWDIGMP